MKILLLGALGINRILLEFGTCLFGINVSVAFQK